MGQHLGPLDGGIRSHKADRMAALTAHQHPNWQSFPQQLVTRTNYTGFAADPRNETLNNIPHLPAGLEGSGRQRRALGCASLLPGEAPTSSFPLGVSQHMQPWSLFPTMVSTFPRPPQVQQGWKSLQSSSRDSAVSPRQRHRPVDQRPPEINTLLLAPGSIDHGRRVRRHSRPKPLTFSHNVIGRIRLAAKETFPVASQGAKAEATKDERPFIRLGR